MSCVLVTGGSGFIGSAVVKALAARGDEVIVFDIARSARIDTALAEFRNVEFVQGEITEWPQIMTVVQVNRPDAIVHCAAIGMSMVPKPYARAPSISTAHAQNWGTNRAIQSARDLPPILMRREQDGADPLLNGRTDRV